MRGTALVFSTLILIAVFAASSAPALPARADIAPTVEGVELVSGHRIPEAEVLEAIGPMGGGPRSRALVRASLDRLWALGFFSRVWVEELQQDSGVRLRYHLERRPHIRTIRWKGETGLDISEIARAVDLALGESADPARLARARNDLLRLYRSEGFFAARVDVEAAEDPETNARDLTFVLRPGDRARVGGIEIQGLSQVSGPIVTQAFGIRRGDDYREASAAEGIRRVKEKLRSEGFFEASVVAGDPVWRAETNRVDLSLRVAEGPRFRVEFLGNNELRDPFLMRRLTFADSGVVDEIEVEANARQLESAYRENGYHFVRIESSLYQDGLARVVRFQVTEGPKVTVESIEFSGHIAFSESRLGELMQTRPAGLFSAGLFRQEVFDLDLSVLVSFLRSEGFPEASVGPAELRFAEDRSRVRITIPIVEGPRWKVGKVAVEGQTVFAAGEILEALPLKQGDFWDRTVAEQGVGVIERLYSRRGYHAPAIDLEAARKEGSVDVVYRVREGASTRIGRILVSGLVLTDERVVLRDLPFRPGDPLNPESLLEAERRLAGLGLFDEIEVEPLRPPPLPFADVRVNVRERRPWRLDFGLGFSTDEGARGFLEVGHDNLLGTGRSVSMREKLSSRGDRTDLTYQEPWLMGTRWQAEARFFREIRDEIGFDLERIGMTLGAQRELFPDYVPGLRAVAGYRLEQVRRFRVNPALAVADVESGREVIGRMVSSLTLDRRDNPVDPRQGSYHLISAELGGVALGSDLNFFKSRLETHWLFDWLPPSVFALSARLGLATPLGKTPDVPIEDRFFAGGSTTVRGFRENRLGPRDAARNPTGGKALALFNSEWRFPLWRWFGGALFLDVGAVAPEVGKLSASDFRPGAGGGLRVNTPVGPIRLDLGYALRPISGEKRWQIYITVGNPF